MPAKEDKTMISESFAKLVARPLLAGINEMYMTMRAEEVVAGQCVEQVLGIEIYDTGASANATGKRGKLTTL